MLVAALSAGAVLLWLASPTSGVADGNGSPGACLTSSAGVLKVEGNDNLLVANAPAGRIVAFVCIKSGSNMFGGQKHSDPLGNGPFSERHVRYRSAIEMALLLRSSVVGVGSISPGERLLEATTALHCLSYVVLPGV